MRVIRPNRVSDNSEFVADYSWETKLSPTPVGGAVNFGMFEINN